MQRLTCWLDLPIGTDDQKELKEPLLPTSFDDDDNDGNDDVMQFGEKKKRTNFQLL